MIRLEIRLGSWREHRQGFTHFREIYQGEPFVALGKVLRVKKTEDSSGSLYQIAVHFISVDEGHRQAVDKFIQKLIQKKVDYENSCR